MLCQHGCINNGGAENTALRPCIARATAVCAAQNAAAYVYKPKVSIQGSIGSNAGTSVLSRAEQRGQLPLKSVVTFVVGSPNTARPGHCTICVDGKAYRATF